MTLKKHAGKKTGQIIANSGHHKWWVKEGNAFPPKIPLNSATRNLGSEQIRTSFFVKEYHLDNKTMIICFNTLIYNTDRLQNQGFLGIYWIYPPLKGSPPSQAFSCFPCEEGVFLNLGLFPPKNTLKPQVSSRQKRPSKSLPWSLD